MCSSYGYKSMPYMLGLISVIEMLVGIARIVIFFSPKPTNTDLSAILSTLFNNSQTIPSPFLSSTQAKAAFALDWISSIVPIFMGIYVALFICLSICYIGGTCRCIYDCYKREKDCAKIGVDCCCFLCQMCANKANHRCVSLTCNYPCYEARPWLRFKVRIGLLTFFIVLRIIATILYVSDKSLGVYGKRMAVLCAATVVLVVLSMLLDLYHYRVWWYYRPDGAYKKCRCCCCKQRFHPSHKRFLPSPLSGKYRDKKSTTNSLCKQTVSDGCADLSLEHIVIFHTFDFKPLRRFQQNVDKTYIGYHQTKPESAVAISQESFKISRNKQQMLGFGIYFARSFASTQGKAREAGKSISLCFDEFEKKKHI